MRKTLDWEPYFEIARQEMPFRERLGAYARVARERLGSSRLDLDVPDRGHVVGP